MDAHVERIHLRLERWESNERIEYPMWGQPRLVNPPISRTGGPGPRPSSKLSVNVKKPCPREHPRQIRKFTKKIRWCEPGLLIGPIRQSINVLDAVLGSQFTGAQFNRLPAAEAVERCTTTLRLRVVVDLQLSAPNPANSVTKQAIRSRPDGRGEYSR